MITLRRDGHKMMNIELVIFDMDGLMFDTETVSREAWKIAGEKVNMPVDDELFSEFLGTNSKYITNLLINKFGEKSPYKELISERNIMADKLIDMNGLRVKKGLKELLAYLKENNIKRAVATSTSRARALKLLTLGGVVNEFDYIICGDEVTKSKPDPEIFLKVAEKLNVLPENCIVLEDSRFGVYAAKNAGMYPIMVPDLLTPDEELLGMIYKKADDLGQVIELLK